MRKFILQGTLTEKKVGMKKIPSLLLNDQR